MLAAVDVDYHDPDATAACVLFASWTDGAPAHELVERVTGVAAYVPGRFFERELPCLRAVLARAPERPELVVVDGYVWLGEGRKGLGTHLHDAIGVPVIGVAKTEYVGAPAIPILRGASAAPLFVSAIGLDPPHAAASIRAMHGPHRLPTLLKHADHLARSPGTGSTPTTRRNR